MQLTRWGAAKTNADVMSGILNCVCPECGGSMGAIGREFKCQGECRTDWRPIWEQVLPAGLTRRTTKETGQI
jgi:tRNA(Ile2) C34 agmatinyltransferase TiaS